MCACVCMCVCVSVCVCVFGLVVWCPPLFLTTSPAPLILSFIHGLVGELVGWLVDWFVPLIIRHDGAFSAGWSFARRYFYENALTGETSWSKPRLLGDEDYERRYRRVPIEEHNIATFIQSRHRGRMTRRWFQTFLLDNWEWRIDAKTGDR